MQKEFWKLSGNILFSLPHVSAILVRKKRHSPSPRPSPLKGEGDQGKVLHGRKRHSPSPRPSPLKGEGDQGKVLHGKKRIIILTPTLSWKRNGIIHPHLDPLQQEEGEVFTLTLTLSPQGRGNQKGNFSHREREIRVRVFHRDKFYCNLARPSAHADSESNIRKG